MANGKKNSKKKIKIVKYGQSIKTILKKNFKN